MNLLAILESMRRGLKGVIYASCAALVVLMVADVVLRVSHHGHEAAAPEGGEHAVGFWTTAYHVAEGLPVFWTVFGLLGCVVLVIVSKAVVGPFVSKHEDYYDE
jgi:hypothetical protein